MENVGWVLLTHTCQLALRDHCTTLAVIVDSLPCIQPCHALTLIQRLRKHALTTSD